KETPLKETLADVIETLRGQLAGDNEELAQIATEMNACWRWRVPCRHADAMIAAGDVLLLGGQNEVAAVDMAGGRLLWTGTVAGRACGLAFADGRLLVSTDRGAIHCFEASLGSNEPSATPVQEPADPVATQVAPSDRESPADERSIHPHIRHTGAGRVVISWKSERPCRSTIQFGLLGSTSPTGEAWLDSVAEDEPATDHAVVMDGLEPDRQYAFRVVAHDPDSDLSLWTSRRYTFDASMELMPIVPVDTAPVEPESGAAEKIVSQSGLRRGYCLMLGCGDGRLALEIARRTEMQVLGVEEDAVLVETARKMLDAAGAYGRRVVVHQGSLDKLPFPDRFANLIVCGPTLSADQQIPADEVTRLLHPYGCAVLDKGAIVRGKPSPNAGQWTHQYADPGNSACSNDPLGDPKSLQWFGRPGPRQMVDRHHRAMSPLAAGGRLIVPGDNRLMAVDALNGTPLWDVTIPNSRRVVVLRDSGQVALGGQRVYVAVEDTCWVLNAVTGRREQLFRLPPIDDETAHDWGYLASVGDCLLGSGQIRGASRNAHQRSIAAAESHYDNVPTVVSRYLFCLDRRTGRHRWTYRHRQGSVIANPAMAAGADRVFFIESCNPLAVAEPSGRVPLPALLAEGSADLVALDMRSGKIVWRQPLDLSRVRHVLYLYHAGDTVLAVGASDEDRHPRYDLWAFHAVDGRPKWANHHVRTDKPAGGSHGEQDQHPVIVGDVVYSRPAAFELETGRPLPFTLDRGGGGCGTLSGSAEYLFGRGSQPRIYPLDSGGRASRPLSTVSRPGCWINIISADGLVLVPEASSGCSCPLRRSSVDRVFPIADRAIPTILTPADLWYTPAGSQVSSHQGTRDGRARADM
ncbi:MAG: PQQ-binding-like beta-propeller repeat protein, partial [Planctomycetes bacterium]|nr:PQQ-binding-like beta-propeller repeat protein [Planctomycetota bacterium]